MARVISQSRADIVAKVDADTLVFPGALDWLAACTTKARGFRIGQKFWAGLWAVRCGYIGAVCDLIARSAAFNPLLISPLTRHFP